MKKPVEDIFGLFDKDHRPQKGDSWAVSIAKMEAMMVKQEREKK